MKHFIISDLHLNMGRMEDGRLHPLEDFDSDAAFAKLLETIRESAGQLIINGDWVDFLQLEPFWTPGGEFSLSGTPLGWTQSTALAKLETALSRHQRHFSDLTDYLKTPGSKLTVLQGNHDADWFFPGSEHHGPPLQVRLRQALGNPPAERIEFIATSMRLGNVHVEHGHQQCEPMNAFQNHPNIFDRDRHSPILGEPRFELLWGSRFVLNFFNKLEMQYPFADNLKTMTRAMLLGIKNGWVDAGTAADALKFFWGSGLPWRDIPEVLGDETRNPLGLVQGLQNQELAAIFLERLQSDDSFAKEVAASLGASAAEELESLHTSERMDVGDEEIRASDAETLGVFRDSREIRQARKLMQPDVTAVLFGHTHQEIDGNDPAAPVPGYFNTGTWTPRFDLRKKANRDLLKKGKLPIQVLSDRTYFELRLMYAEVDDQTGRVELKEMN